MRMPIQAANLTTGSNNIFVGKFYKSGVDPNKYHKRRAKPAIRIHFGAADNDISNGQVLYWEGAKYDFTNADDKTLTQMATNICDLAHIGVPY